MLRLRVWVELPETNVARIVVELSGKDSERAGHTLAHLLSDRLVSALAETPTRTPSCN